MEAATQPFTFHYRCKYQYTHWQGSGLKIDTSAHRLASFREPFPSQVEAAISLYSAGLCISGDQEDLK